MSITCITTLGLPGIRPCTYRGEHEESCNSETCAGCLPRLAEVGFLCRAEWEFLQGVHIEWATFRQRLEETGGRAVSADSGGIKGSSPIGFTNLTTAFVTLDEIDRLLESLAGKTLEAWVHTEQGAADAIMFAHAAKRAYGTFPVDPAKERAVKVERKRCKSCFMLWPGEHPTRRERGETVVVCHWCGAELDRIPDHPKTGRVLGMSSPIDRLSEACESQAHHTCPDVNCRCDCHLERDRSLYTVSTPAHLLGAALQRPVDAGSSAAGTANDTRVIQPLTEAHNGGTDA